MTSTSATSIKLSGTRGLGCVVHCMEWSNKMDLIAYGNDKGQVVIQRLNWFKVITFPAPEEDIKVRSLSWQKNETILAVGYSNGQVAFLDVELEDVVSGLSYHEDIKKLYFSKNIDVPDFRNLFRNRSDLNADLFLPPLPVLNGLNSTVKSIERQKSFTKGSPCFLVVILASGKVHLLLLGALRAGVVNIGQHITSSPSEFEVFDVRVVAKCNMVIALIRDGDKLKLLQYYNPILDEHMSPLLQVATYCAHIIETKNYINDSIQCLSEAWETVLMEMDNKLTKYANSQPEGQLSADLLELLLFGWANRDIQDFLTEELTEKGLKKLANSVDLSYSTIQNLVSKPLQSAGINLFYNINMLKGLSRVDHFFENFLVENLVVDALRLCGSYLIKVLELQQVIDQCVNDLKLFFCWLCTVIARLHQPEAAEEQEQVTPEDIIYLSEYLNSFEDGVIYNDDGTVIKRKFNLEKVGQYLLDQNLQQEIKPDVHHLWSQFVEENECLNDSPHMYPHNKEASLIQQRDDLFMAINELFCKPNDSISNEFHLMSCILCARIPRVPPTIENDFVRCSTYYNEQENKELFLVTINWQEALILDFEVHYRAFSCIRLNLLPGPFTIVDPTSILQNLHFVDIKFYNENFLSLLLKNQNENLTTTQQYHFVHLNLEVLRKKQTLHMLPQSFSLYDFSLPQSLHDVIDYNNMTSVDGVCTRLAVSGPRKVATILSDGNRRMTLIELEVEDDEDDLDISQTSVLEAK